MSYDKRVDGRKFDEIRPMEAKAGIIARADGSAKFTMGKTVALAAVYGPRNLFPKFKQDPQKGILRVNYNMLPFSSKGERVRPGGGRRSKELSMVIEKALLPVLDLSEFPNSVIDLFIEFPQTDAGTRCAGICAASIALADAGIIMKDMVAAVGVGRVQNQVCVDLCYDEEAFDPPVADVPVAMLSRTKEISLLQMDGELEEEQLYKALEMAKKACDQINKLQMQALKDKYKVEGEKNVK